MKERPILFSAPMVRALLAGTKTQTRRVVHPHHLAQINLTRGAAVAYWSEPMPYGRPGDRLWVRETWRTDARLNDKAPNEFSGWPVKYEADSAVLNHGAFFGQPDGKTRTSIHMPRWASRITLEITSVRVERLQDISEADAMAEGAALKNSPAAFLTSYVRGFRDLWESINGPGSWDANPWVWAIGFRRLA